MAASTQPEHEKFLKSLRQLKLALWKSTAELLHLPEMVDEDWDLGDGDVVLLAENRLFEVRGLYSLMVVRYVLGLSHTKFI